MEQGLQLQKDFDLDLFMETSAKSGLNTEELFIQAAKLLFRDYNKYKKNKKKMGEKLQKEEVNVNPKKGKCC